MNNPWRFFRAALFFFVGSLGILIFAISVVLLGYGYGFGEGGIVTIGWLLLFFAVVILFLNAVSGHNRDPNTTATLKPPTTDAERLRLQSKRSADRKKERHSIDEP